jgi:glucosyl-dolichyl phosphate glucuronosyltransferase
LGSSDSLSTERAYTTKVLPSGVWRGLADSARQRSLAGLGRAAAIVGGLAITTYGYGLGRLKLLGKKGAQP